MSFGRLLGKHAWIGLALAVAMLLLSVMVGGILAVRGVIPAEGMTPWVVAGCGLAAAAGGCAAGKGRGSLCAVVVSLLLYGVMWIAALATSEPLNFSLHGVEISCAVMGGGLLSSLLCRGGKKKRKTRMHLQSNRYRRKAA